MAAILFDAQNQRLARVVTQKCFANSQHFVKLQFFPLGFVPIAVRQPVYQIKMLAAPIQANIQQPHAERQLLAEGQILTFCHFRNGAVRRSAVMRARQIHLGKIQPARKCRQNRCMFHRHHLKAYHTLLRTKKQGNRRGKIEVLPNKTIVFSYCIVFFRPPAREMRANAKEICYNENRISCGRHLYGK